MLSRYYCIFILCFHWFISVPKGYAREWVAVCDEFSGVFESYGKGKFKGLGVDMMRLIVEQWGDTIRFKSFPWARAQMKVEQGQADILIGLYRNPERELRFTYSRIPFYEDTMLFYIKGKDARIWNGDYVGLRAKRIGHILGWAYGPSFDQARDSLSLIKSATLEDGISKLLKGHIDILAANHRNMDGWISKQKTKPGIHAVEPIITLQKGYFAFPKKTEYEVVRDRFDVAMQRLVDHHNLEDLAKKYKVNMPSND